ncbi:hypothetical protein [Desulfosporosinus sp. FKA]|uniref:hypothetical protein n=1 Tax=Desulfosporosinus sp. FKA TaxID=1969834 RepID=UPI000B49E623|nr:hypothetical protein [Desulfosporosinus sp. FKA]
MKQRISTDQIQQLTAQQRDKLKEWWMPSFGDLFVFEDYCDENLFDTEDEININFFNAKIKPFSLPLLSVGQCLSLLAPYNPKLNLESNGLWHLEIQVKNDQKIYMEKDPIDVLFQAVKLVIS